MDRPAQPLDISEAGDFDALLRRLSDEFGRAVRVTLTSGGPGARFAGTLASIEPLVPGNDPERLLTERHGEHVFVHVAPAELGEPPPLSHSADREWNLPPDAAGFLLRRGRFERADQSGGGTVDNPFSLMIVSQHPSPVVTVTLSPRR